MTTANQEKVPLWLKWEELTRACQTPEIAGSAGAIQVMRALLDDLDRDGRRQCYPSLDRLAQVTGLSRRSVVTALSRLEAEQLITRSTGGGRGRSTRYGFPWIEAQMSRRENSEPERSGSATAHEGAGAAATSGSPDQRAAPARAEMQQSALLLPLDGGKSQGVLAAKISRRFVIKRDDAEGMVRRWCARFGMEMVQAAIDEAIADGIEREQLARYVAQHLAAPSAASAPSKPDPAATQADDETGEDPRWQRVRARLRDEIGQSAFDNWLRRVSFVGLSDGCVELCAPSRFVGDWVRSNYADRLRALWIAEDPTVSRVSVSHEKALARSA
ncbi:hypothetical protein CKO28_08990 [Rhodovibrio sodomensis]|uniref:DnaA N-terminal domain-containing protein n=1 Tax=Rhodovibrio sodomensis TaxID=1088 RepID=A0ABS1DDY0_9PROT|nr:DnaA N-terminal domain-containing protein [Rhodovibrio sodomensis]MBK1668171.1 hypothetical protein [Rhodovibrio sodomensis]